MFTGPLIHVDEHGKHRKECLQETVFNGFNPTITGSMTVSRGEDTMHTQFEQGWTETAGIGSFLSAARFDGTLSTAVITLDLALASAMLLLLLTVSMSLLGWLGLSWQRLRLDRQDRLDRRLDQALLQGLRHGMELLARDGCDLSTADNRQRLAELAADYARGQFDRSGVGTSALVRMATARLADFDLPAVSSAL
jgi:hypothetical protein